MQVITPNVAGMFGFVCFFIFQVLFDLLTHSVLNPMKKRGQGTSLIYTQGDGKA